MDETSELIQQRIKKLEMLRKDGSTPTERFRVTHTSRDLHGGLRFLSDEELKSVWENLLPGRADHGIRDFGKASFIQIQDRKGRIQAYLQRDIVGSRFSTL